MCLRNEYRNLDAKQLPGSEHDVGPDFASLIRYAHFLPTSGRLMLREDNVKVTLSLSQRSVSFFKCAGRQRRVPYQRMIRTLVDAYAEKQGEKGGEMFW